jgi:hypothetical protein
MRNSHALRFLLTPLLFVNSFAFAQNPASWTLDQIEAALPHKTQCATPIHSMMTRLKRYEVAIAEKNEAAQMKLNGEMHDLLRKAPALHCDVAVTAAYITGSVYLVDPNSVNPTLLWSNQDERILVLSPSMRENPEGNENDPELRKLLQQKNQKGEYLIEARYFKEESSIYIDTSLAPLQTGEAMIEAMRQATSEQNSR